MRQLLILFTSCAITGYCYGQPLQQTDSLRAKTLNGQHINDSIEASRKAELSVYPNPAKNKVTLQVKGFKAGAVAVKIIDDKGKLIREDSRLLTSSSEDIIMFLMLPPGIYFILVTDKEKVARRRVVMQ